MTEQEARALIRKHVVTWKSTVNLSMTRRVTSHFFRRRFVENGFKTTQFFNEKRLIAHLIRYRVRTLTPDDGFNWLTGRMEG